MAISFDQTKNAANKAKHGLWLSDAQHLDWELLYSVPDTRHAYGEARFKGMGPIEGRLYCVVYTLRGDTYRIISFRKANQREFDDYEKHTS